jgi:hypothetical protein
MGARSAKDTLGLSHVINFAWKGVEYDYSYRTKLTQYSFGDVTSREHNPAKIVEVFIWCLRG